MSEVELNFLVNIVLRSKVFIEWESRDWN